MQHRTLRPKISKNPFLPHQIRTWEEYIRQRHQGPGRACVCLQPLLHMARKKRNSHNHRLDGGSRNRSRDHQALKTAHPRIRNSRMDSRSPRPSATWMVLGLLLRLQSPSQTWNLSTHSIARIQPPNLHL